MTNETQKSTQDAKPTPFGERLKTAREAMGLERKDAAAQLRLSEKIIVMMEKDRYPVDLPVTFIRGYIRSYGKLLQIPEYEIRKGIEPIKPVSVMTPPPVTIKPAAPVTSGNYFMQFFTYLIVFTLLGLVAMWWYTHQTLPAIAETQSIPINTNPIPAVKEDSNQPVALNSESIALPAKAPALVNGVANNQTANASNHPNTRPALAKPASATLAKNDLDESDDVEPDSEYAE